MHAGKMVCYVSTTKNIGGSGRVARKADQRNMGAADVTQFVETINDTSASKVNQLFNRAAAALNVRKSDLVCEDIHGNKYFGASIERGSSAVGQDQPYV